MKARQTRTKVEKMGQDGNEHSKTVHIGSILPGLIKSCRKPADNGLIRIWEIWDEAVGEAVAANAQPWAFKETLLLVHVSSSPWLHQLRFMKQEIIARVNAALGGTMVGEMKFKIGPVDGKGKD